MRTWECGFPGPGIRRSGVRGLSPEPQERIVAKVNPGEFMRQVRAEGSKVVWPSLKETRTTAIMVLIMTTLLAIFFFGIDSAFGAVVKWLLSLIG